MADAKTDLFALIDVLFTAESIITEDAYEDIFDALSPLHKYYESVNYAKATLVENRDKHMIFLIIEVAKETIQIRGAVIEERIVYTVTKAVDGHIVAGSLAHPSLQKALRGVAPPRPPAGPIMKPESVPKPSVNTCKTMAKRQRR